MKLILTTLWRGLRKVIGALFLVQLGLIVILKIVRKVYPAPARPEHLPPLQPPPTQLGTTQVQIYTTGATLFRDMLAAINAAQETILFETFLWHADDLGQQFKDTLIARARAGVQVYIIYDWMGNVMMPPAFRRFPALPTLHLLPYSSIRHQPGYLLDPRRLGRDHRKILVVDGQVGFVGGYNIGALYQPWRDTQVCLCGPAALDLAHAFAAFWNSYRGKLPALPLPHGEWQSDIRVYCNDRLQLIFPIRDMYIQAIQRAQKRIRVTQAYLAPDPPIINELIRAAARGVDVQILIPWPSNHFLPDWIGRRQFGRLLRGGIRIFGYIGPTLHAKTMTIDGQWSTIGATNLDRLSMIGMNEINVELFDAELAAQMEEIFARDCTSAREIRREAWEQRPWYWRVVEWLLAPLWPLV